MKNRELKQRLVIDGTYQKYCAEVTANRLNEIYEDTANMHDLNQIEFESCSQLRNAKNKTWSRLYLHNKYLKLKYGDNLYFVTLTFSEETMKLKADYRRELIAKLLQTYCDDYIANIDYGDTTQREHYHAVIVPKIEHTPYIEKRGKKNRLVCCWLDQYADKYGFYSIEKIETDIDDITMVSRYLSKITNHSIKVKQTKIMTKKDSDYHRWKRHFDKTRYHLPIENTRDRRQKTYETLVDLFGRENIEIVSKAG